MGYQKKQNKNKMKRFTRLTKNVFGLILIGIMILSFTSCTQKITFLTSSVVPAAQGYVKIKTDDNQNYDIQIQISGLAEVERLQSFKHIYVVWMETDQGVMENLGQLNSSTGFLSKKLKASLETVSSYKPIKIFITAEDEINVRYPGNQLVLSTARF